MAVSYTPGQTLGRGDLNIFLTDSTDNPANAAEITYALYYYDTSGPIPVEVLIGDPARVPVNPQIGEYYAAFQIPGSAVSGEYHIKWTFRQFVSSPQQQVAQIFQVVGADSSLLVVNYSDSERDMIRKLRMHLRDQNPDKFYHFRPPEHEGEIGRYNRVFGQIWEDAELYEYLVSALDWFNMFPPFTGNSVTSIDSLVSSMPAWRTAIIWNAITQACFALFANWVADEFEYSIGGVSLSIDKSSKYQAMMDAASAQFEKATEAKARTVKFIRGLQQPRFGIGVRSSWGPYTARGVLSPRNFV